MRDHPSLRRELARGELVRLLYRLGRHGASGVLTISARASAAVRPEVFVLRRGCALDQLSAPLRVAARPGGAGTFDHLSRSSFPGEGARAVGARLARLAAQDELLLVFEGGVTEVIPPGASHGISLAAWARAHLEQQLDGSLAEALVRQLAGVRLTLRPELAPEPADEADRRMLAAMAQPRRLEQIWPLARTPRFRLLAFVHFLRAVDALDGAGIAAERSGPAAAPPRPDRGGLAMPDPRRVAALRMLGIDAAADPDDVKRAYRRLARALHPDLQPDADAERRRTLERRFAEVTAAYEALV